MFAVLQALLMVQFSSQRTVTCKFQAIFMQSFAFTCVCVNRLKCIEQWFSYQIYSTLSTSLQQIGLHGA